jgi:hypothetical protein
MLASLVFAISCSGSAADPPVTGAAPAGAAAAGPAPAGSQAVPERAEQAPAEGSNRATSEWGSERDARGHPYLGELKGRLYSVWQVPWGPGGDTLGCLKLGPDGKVVDRQVKGSGNGDLDRSVEEALRTMPEMGQPVPDELLPLLTEKGICFRFAVEKEDGAAPGRR